MRKSFHTLSGLVTNKLGGNSLNGDVYIFINRSRNRIKLLHWEHGRMVIYMKMPESGTFGVPKMTGTGVIEWRDLVLLAEGIMENSNSRRQRLESLIKLRK